MTTRLRRVPAVALFVALLAALLTPTSAAAVPPPVAAPRLLWLGDSITHQVCEGDRQQIPADAPEYLRVRDGGCYGFSGATTADLVFMYQGGRYAVGTGQPHPWFPARYMADPYSLPEAMDRADAVVIGLGTNELRRERICAGATGAPFPVAHPANPAYGPTPAPCSLTPAQYRAHIDYLMWRAGGRPVFWFDLAVTDPDWASAEQVQAYNDVLHGSTTRWANLHPVAWSSAVAGNPALLSDGVHVTEAGRRQRYLSVLDALWGCGYR